MKIFYIFLIFFICSCGQSDVTIHFKKPPMYSLTLKTNNIAILSKKTNSDLEEEVLEQLRSRIEQSFISENTYKPVDLSSESTRDTLIELGLSESTGLDEKKLLQIGKGLNVSLLLTPTIRINHHIKPQIKSRTIRVGTGRFRYKVINGVRTPIEIERQDIVHDHYETKTMSISCHITLVNVETGEIISTFNEKTYPPYKSTIITRRGAQGHQIHEFMRDVFDNTPTRHKEEAPFIESFIEKVTRRSVNQISPVLFDYQTSLYDCNDLEIGNRFAHLNNWQKASDEWEIVLMENPENYKCLNNLGAAYFALNDLEKSLEYLQQAYAIKDDENILTLSHTVEKLLKKHNTDLNNDK